ncbi:unnamed protein product [Rotaria sp. Silwood1]|nr:unnamed protein product [Rotaria sp. Silwood1]
MFKRTQFFLKHDINEVNRFIEEQDNAFGYGFTTILSDSQSPTPCHGCLELMDSRSTCIYIKRADCNSIWHPQCFICTKCKQFLVNLIYFYKNGQLYCEQHHAKLYKRRYTGGDLIIFIFTCNEYKDRGSDMYRFCCSFCKQYLAGERYIERRGQLFCLDCFETTYAEYCDICCEPIGPSQARITYESHQWHATETCFYCYVCLIPLNNSDFLQDYGILFCSNECASQISNHSISTKLIQQNNLHSNGMLSLISCTKSIITSQFPRSSSLNGSSRFTKQYRVHFVGNEKEKNSKYSPTMSYKSKFLCRSLSSSSSTIHDDNQEDINSIFDQFDMCGIHLRKSINCRTEISYVDETSTINTKLMKKTTTLNKKQKNSNEKRGKTNYIVSSFFFCIYSKSLH